MQQVKLSNKNRVDKQQSYQNGVKFSKKSDLDGVSDNLERKIYKSQSQFMFDRNQMDNPQIIRYMNQEFVNKCFTKFEHRGKYRAKRLGNKDKYERNLITGKFMKLNPITSTFQKIQRLLVLKEKKFAFEVLQYLFKRKAYDAKQDQ